MEMVINKSYPQLFQDKPVKTNQSLNVKSEFNLGTNSEKQMC